VSRFWPVLRGTTRPMTRPTSGSKKGEDHDEFAGDKRCRFLERRGFAGLAFGTFEMLDTARVFFDVTFNDGAGAVAAAIVNDDNFDFFRRIMHLHQRVERMGNNPLFVMRGNQYGDRGPVGSVDVDERMALLAVQPIERENIMPDCIDDNQDDDTVIECMQQAHCASLVFTWHFLQVA